jgi:hypothetical protein
MKWKPALPALFPPPDTPSEIVGWNAKAVPPSPWSFPSHGKIHPWNPANEEKGLKSGEILPRVGVILCNGEVRCLNGGVPNPAAGDRR